MQEKIVILDFGSQTTQLIGRRVRELSIYSEIIPYNKYPFGREAEEGIIGVILSGSPLSVYDKDAFKVDIARINAVVPVLGICYGAQLMALTFGGSVEPAPSREYGRANLTYIDHACPLFDKIEEGAVPLRGIDCRCPSGCFPGRPEDVGRAVPPRGIPLHLRHAAA